MTFEETLAALQRCVGLWVEVQFGELGGFSGKVETVRQSSRADERWFIDCERERGPLAGSFILDRPTFEGAELTEYSREPNPLVIVEPGPFQGHNHLIEIRHGGIVTSVLVYE